MAVYDNKYPKLGWASCEFIASFMPTTFIGITAVSWSGKRAMENLYGTGSEPIGYALGKSEYEASVTLYREEVEAILAASSTGSITDIPAFDLIITFQREGSTITNVVELKNCRFMEDKLSFKSGDMMLEQEIPLLCGGIKFNGKGR